MAVSPCIAILSFRPIRSSLRNGAEFGADQPNTIDVVTSVPTARRDGAGEHGERPDSRGGSAVDARQRSERGSVGSRTGAGGRKRKLRGHELTVAGQPRSIKSNRKGDFL